MYEDFVYAYVTYESGSIIVIQSVDQPKFVAEFRRCPNLTKLKARVHVCLIRENVLLKNKQA